MSQSDKIPPNLPEGIDSLPENPQVRVIKNYINGEFREPKSGKYIKNLNPATNELLSYIPQSSKDDVDDAVQAAKTCFESGAWSSLSENQRADYLEKIANKIEEKFELFVKLESQGS